MSKALADGDVVLGLLRAARIEDTDMVPALAVALGSLIAEQAWPDDPFLSIVASGGIIGAAASSRRLQLLARGPAFCGAA